MTAPTPDEAAAYISRKVDRHTYSWHASRGTCEVVADGQWCACVHFVDRAGPDLDELDKDRYRWGAE